MKKHLRYNEYANRPAFGYICFNELRSAIARRNEFLLTRCCRKSPPLPTSLSPLASYVFPKSLRSEESYFPRRVFTACHRLVSSACHVARSSASERATRRAQTATTNRSNISIAKKFAARFNRVSPANAVLIRSGFFFPKSLYL